MVDTIRAVGGDKQDGHSQPDRLDSLIEETRTPGLGQLREILGAVARMQKTGAGFPISRPGDYLAITNQLDKLVQQSRRFLRAGDQAFTRRIFDVIGEIKKTDISAYPDELLRLLLVEADILVETGRGKDACALLKHYVDAPYVIQGDLEALQKVMVLHTTASMVAGDVKDLSSLAYQRASLLARQPRADPFAVFRHMAPGISVGNAPGGTLGAAMGILAKALVRLNCASSSSWMRRARNKVGSLCVIYYGGLVLKLITLLARVGKFQSREAFDGLATGTMSEITRDDIVVTRGMGGLGDILMMTPGVVGLSMRYKRPVYFAVPKGLMPLIENNPHIIPVDCMTPLPVHRARKWINLSICPAGQYESKHRPKIRKGRVELFARRMGVTTRRLDVYGWKPHCHLSPEQIALRDRLRNEYAARDLPVVGIQPFSRDEYKNAPNLLHGLRELAKDNLLIVFHSHRMAIIEHPNIIQFVGRPLSDTIAAVAALDYMVAVDSGLYHLAAAFDLPTLGIFGPTDGAPLSRHHRRYRLVEISTKFNCQPCWRYEDRECYLTGTMKSSCLMSITSTDIVKELKALQSTFPQKGKASIL